MTLPGHTSTREDEVQPVIEEALRLPVPQTLHKEGFNERAWEKAGRARSLLMTKDTTFQHAGSTLIFPRKHVTGVFDSLQEGEQAVRALIDAGYHAEDITFIPSQDFPAAFQEHLQKEGLFRRIIHYLQVTSDEGALGELYLAAARQGSHFISVYVPQRERINDLSAVLFSHGARFVKYVSAWSVEDLFPTIKSGE